MGHLAHGSMWDFTVRREQGDQYIGLMCRGVCGTSLGSMWDVTVRREQGDRYVGVMCRGYRGRFSGFGVVSLLVHKGMPSPNTAESRIMDTFGTSILSIVQRLPLIRR